MRGEQAVTVTRAQIVAQARRLLTSNDGQAAAWSHQQRDAGRAVDCAGVPLVVGQALGISTLDIRNYERVPDGNRILEICREHLVEVRRDQMGLGDLLAMKFDAGLPQHFAIVADYKYGGFSIIHSSNAPTLRRVVEHRLTREWAGKIVAVFKSPAVID